jgi:hypothetical protein
MEETMNKRRRIEAVHGFDVSDFLQLEAQEVDDGGTSSEDGDTEVASGMSVFVRKTRSQLHF